jgi:hypothetical protein
MAIHDRQGIAVSASVLMDGDCALSCDVIGDQAQFEFGTGTGSLSLIASEDGLERLAKVASDASPDSRRSHRARKSLSP